MSLFEVIFVIAIFGFVMAAVITFSTSTSKLAPRDQERRDALRDAQAGLALMTRELRQAYAVRSWTANQMDVLVTIRSKGDRRVRYDCGAAYPQVAANPHDDAWRRCVRYEGSDLNSVPSANATVAIDRVLNGSISDPDPVFTYESVSPSQPRFVEARIEAPVLGERNDRRPTSQIVLDDGFHLRNLSLAGD